MDYTQALEYINGVSWRSSKLGLERVNELLGSLGNPQSELRFVHVAGTNGKGSICAMLASILKKAGLKTGLFISPYLRCGFRGSTAISWCSRWGSAADTMPPTPYPAQTAALSRTSALTTMLYSATALSR